MKKSDEKVVLIYDKECPVCRKTIKWIKQNSKKGAFEMLPCQSDAARERYPLIERTACMNAMQLVLPDHKVFAGEKAIPEILKRLKKYSSAAELFRLPGSEIISRAFYRWFANKRYHIAGIFFPTGKRRPKQR